MTVTPTTDTELDEPSTASSTTSATANDLEPAGQETDTDQTPAEQTPAEQTPAEQTPVEQTPTILDAVPPQLEGQPKDSPTRSNGNTLQTRTIVLIALLAGLAIGVATFSINRVAAAAPQAQATLILDENQVGWPFYRAARELAADFMSEPATFDLVQSQISDPEEAKSITLSPTSDLSTLVLTATAESDEAAVELVQAGALALIAHSRSERRAPLEQELEDLGLRIVTVASEVEATATELDIAESESGRIQLNSDLVHLSNRENDLEDSAEEISNKLKATDSVYLQVGDASASAASKQSVMASLAAAAGACVLALLVLSIFTAQDGAD